MQGMDFLNAQTASLPNSTNSLDNRSETILDAMLDGVVIIDRLGTIQSFNTAAENIFGYRKSEVIGKNVTILMPKPHAQHHDRYLSDYLAGETAKIIGIGREISALRKDGSLFPAKLAVTEIGHDQERGFIGVINDLSKHQRIEAELSEIQRHRRINHTLQDFGLRGIPQTELIDWLLNSILSLPGFSEKPRGAIYLIEDNPEILVMKVQQGLDDKLQKQYAEIPLGECRCGDITALDKTGFMECVDTRYEIHFSGISDHDHSVAPIISGDALLGAIVLFVHKEDLKNLFKNGFLSNAARILAEIIEHMRMEENTIRLLQQNRELTKKIINVQEAEIKNIARELHDEMGQLLTAIKTDAVIIANRSKKSHEKEIYRSAQAIDAAASHIYDVTHSMMNRLRPDTLDDLGLVDTLKAFIKNWRRRHRWLPIKLRITGELGNFGETVDITIYRLIQECLTNIVRHAAASHVKIIVSRTQRNPNNVRLVVQDDGRGMNVKRPAQTNNKFGLVGMRERVEGLGGEFIIESEPGAGSSIIANIPIH